jgi:hypothetical protein
MWNLSEGSGGKAAMKRLGCVLIGTVVWFSTQVVPAFAGSELPNPGDSQVRGEIVVPPGATGTTAFTGTNVTVGALIAAVLLVGGTILLIAARRRASSTR